MKCMTFNSASGCDNSSNELILSNYGTMKMDIICHYLVANFEIKRNIGILPSTKIKLYKELFLGCFIFNSILTNIYIYIYI